MCTRVSGVDNIAHFFVQKMEETAMTLGMFVKSCDKENLKIENPSKLEL